MKFGIRVPSLKRRFAARTSLKRIVRHRMGIKMPRGYGFITNPKKFAYNKVYNKTSFSVDRLLTGGRKNTQNTAGSNGGSCLLVGLSIILLFAFWPIGLAFIVYLIIKATKKGANQVSETAASATVSEKSNEVISTQNSKSLVISNVPEPTKSLLWVTNEDASKVESASAIKLTVEIGADGVNVISSKDNPNFFAEPSLIWTRLPIEPNDDLEKAPMYYPSYSGLTPRHKFQYLNWLKDITQETNLSYAFLYFYGLERHLLIGNYDLAVDEILKLLKFHDKGTFKSYAIHSLIAGSVFRKRPDIIDKAPFILDDVSDLALALKISRNQGLSAKDVVAISSRIGFSNRRYIKMFPDLFEKELQNQIGIFEEKEGSLLSQLDYGSLSKGNAMVFANLSIPDKVRTVEFPQILEDSKFQTLIKSLLQNTHDAIKNRRNKNG